MIDATSFLSGVFAGRVESQNLIGSSLSLGHSITSHSSGGIVDFDDARARRECGQRRIGKLTAYSCLRARLPSDIALRGVLARVRAPRSDDVLRSAETPRVVGRCWTSGAWVSAAIRPVATHWSSIVRRRRWTARAWLRPRETPQRYRRRHRRAQLHAGFSSHRVSNLLQRKLQFGFEADILGHSDFLASLRIRCP